MGQVLTPVRDSAPGRLTRTLIFAAAAIVSLLIAEWSVRLALPDYDPRGQIAYRFHSVAGTYLGVPGSSARQIKNSGDYNVAVRFNEHGFRDRRDVATGTVGDIYVTGDSFTFGWGVEEDKRFSSVLETLTGRRVFNVSASSDIEGYARALAYAQKLGATVRDVVVAVNMIDDVRDYSEAAEAKKPALAPEANETPLTLLSIKALLLRESALYFLITTTVGSVEWVRAALVKVGLIETIKSISGGLPGDPAIRSTVDRLAALAREYRLSVMIIPSRGLWVGADRDSVSRIHERFKAALERRGLTVVDLRPRMEAGGKPMGYHFRNDGHWIPKGHALAAEALAAHLSRTSSK